MSYIQVAFVCGLIDEMQFVRFRNKNTRIRGSSSWNKGCPRTSFCKEVQISNGKVGSRYLRGVLWVHFMIILPYTLIYQLIMVILINDAILIIV